MLNGDSLLGELATKNPKRSGWSVLNSLVSLVSGSARNWCYLCETVEGVEKGEIIEIANVDTDFMHLIENMTGCKKPLGEYPTLSAIIA